MKWSGSQARQTSEILSLTRQMLFYIDQGLTPHAAKEISQLLVPTTTATVVAITEGDTLIGWQAAAGGESISEETIARLARTCGRKALENNEVFVLREPSDLGAPEDTEILKAAIVRPLHVGRHGFGSLIFFYRKLHNVNDVQESLAEGFGSILSTQLASLKLEEQAQLATSMKLKALQNQINPHFLFNTINTIASLIRTDPMKARSLLREFATFYRRTLEDTDLILLSREAEQTYRYFMFELARFGEDRVELKLDEGPGVEDMLVPPFLLQPLVENSIHHAMPAEGKLTITITARKIGDRLIIRVIDNGTGMSEEVVANIMHPESSTGAGIAVKNVYDRIQGFFGPESTMRVESELGKGTTVTLDLKCIDEKQYVSSVASSARGASS